MAALLLLVQAAGFLPTGNVVRDNFDVCELNHYYGQDGSLVFDQVMWLDWDAFHGRYVVQAWRILKDVREEPKQVRKAPGGWTPPKRWTGSREVPTRRWDQRGVWVATWYDKKDRVIRQVAAQYFRETTTSYDPEVKDREWLPDNMRRGLTKVKKRLP